LDCDLAEPIIRPCLDPDVRRSPEGDCHGDQADVQHFICEKGTSEFGGECPYFLTWVGNVADNVSTVHYTRQAVWNDNVPENPDGIWLVNEAIVRNFDLSPLTALALTLMIEEDESTATDPVAAIQGSPSWTFKHWTKPDNRSTGGSSTKSQSSPRGRRLAN
jgi:hypothetical protein